MDLERNGNDLCVFVPQLCFEMRLSFSHTHLSFHSKGMRGNGGSFFPSLPHSRSTESVLCVVCLGVNGNEREKGFDNGYENESNISMSDNERVWFCSFTSVTILLFFGCRTRRRSELKRDM